MGMQKSIVTSQIVFRDVTPLLDDAFDIDMDEEDNLHFFGSAETLGVHGAGHDEEDEMLLAA